MRSSVRSAAFVVSVALFLVACPSAPTRVCTPGASSACVGPGGCMGGQVCNADGTALGTCDCGGPVDAGPVDAGAPSDVPPALDVPAPPGDTGAVDAPGDAAATACDPITQGGCGLGERCVWRILMDTPESIGELACVADGTVAEGDPCTQGAPGVATGFDDCQAGLVCINGACAAICDFGDASSCGPTGYCTRYAGLFQNGEDDPVAGACNASCDPVTQLRADGTSCGASQGCYMLLSPASTLFVCAGAGSIAVGSTIAGTLYANVCVPGATPSRRADGTNYCTAHCRPIETHSGAPAGAAGMAPYSCPERGASSPPHECLFGAFFSGMDPPDPRLNTLGVCFDRTGHLYDSNGDMTPDAPWPSCTTLANTDANGDGVADHRYFGCAPALLP